MSATAVASPFVASGFASMIKPGGELALFYAESLVKGIDAASFYRMPSPVKDSKLHEVNSAGFNLGHLSNYPDVRILPLLGREDLVRPLPYSVDLFKAGAPCGPSLSGIAPSSTFCRRFRTPCSHARTRWKAA
jgi:hypothetical protein